MNGFKPLKMGGTSFRLMALCGCLAISAAVHSESLLRYLPPFAPTGMVPLGGDSLLLWREDGQGQIRDGKGEWTSGFHMPLSRVMHIKPGNSGFLVLGAPTVPFGPGMIAEMNPAGHEIDRWLVKDAWNLVADFQGRRAVTRSGLVPLLPRGLLGPEEPFPEWHGRQPGEVRFPPEVLSWRGITVFCHRADLSLQYFAHARCERAGPEGWVREGGESMSTPVACGPWLLVKEGKHSEQLVVLELATGQERARRSYASEPRLACFGEDQLAVGGKRLELARLPSLKPCWHYPLAKNPVVELIATEHHLVFRGENSPDLLLISRPAPCNAEKNAN